MENKSRIKEFSKSNGSKSFRRLITLANVFLILFISILNVRCTIKSSSPDSNDTYTTENKEINKDSQPKKNERSVPAELDRKKRSTTKPEINPEIKKTISDSYGLPVKSPTCAKNINLKSPRNGAGVYFNQDCSVAFVLPPKKGTVSIISFSPLMSVGLCTYLENTKNTLNIMLKKHENIKDQITTLKNNSSENISTNSYVKTQTEISKLEKDLKSLYSVIQVFETSLQNKRTTATGEALMRYSFDWANLVKDYENLNPEIHFVRLPIEFSNISIMNINKTETEYESATTMKPEILAYTPSDLMDRVDLNVEFNFQGLCYLLKDGKLPTQFKTSELNSDFSLIAEYNFNLKNASQYQTRYNLSLIGNQIIDRLKQETSFSRSMLSTIASTEINPNELQLKNSISQTDPESDSNFKINFKSQLLVKIFKDLATTTKFSLSLPTTPPPLPYGIDESVKIEFAKYDSAQIQYSFDTLQLLGIIFENQGAVQNYINQHDTLIEETVTTQESIYTNLMQLEFQ